MNQSLYKVSPNELPRYTLREAAHYLRMPENTLKRWVSGRLHIVASKQTSRELLIQRPDPGDSRLSFSNLLEAYVIGALRKQYHVKMDDVREALAYSRETLGVDRVLLSKELRVIPGNVFLQHLGKLINVGRGGQEGMPEILEAYLQRIEWDLSGTPLRMFPITRLDYRDAPKLVTIDPVVAFGRPVLERMAIKTSTIAERFNAGESIRAIAEDYDLEAFEVEEALRYEALALAA